MDISKRLNILKALNDNHDLKLVTALGTYLGRQARTEQPAGEYRNGVYHPSETELQDCCGAIPESHRYAHCRSLGHVAKLYGVEARALQNLLVKYTNIRRAK